MEAEKEAREAAEQAAGDTASATIANAECHIIARDSEVAPAPDATNHLGVSSLVDAPATYAPAAASSTTSSAPTPIAPVPARTPGSDIVPPSLYASWDDAEVIARVFRGVDDLSYESAHGLFRLHVAYYRGHLDEALQLATALQGAPEKHVAVTALATHLVVSVALGDSSQAHQDFLRVKQVCEHGLAQTEDDNLLAASLLAALRVENVLMANVFDLPDLTLGFDVVPHGLRMYFGYMIALRMLRNGQPEGAAGVAFTFLTLVGSIFPGARSFLHLVAAAAHLVSGNLGRARAEFDKAWALKEEYGIVMPYVELNYILLGLARKRRRESDPAEMRHADVLIRQFHDGWYGLRRKCGLSHDTETLTPLESYSVGLAALGWRNKEIADHLGVSDNTVKHQLSSAYQKLHISSRSELHALIQFMRPEENDSQLWA